MELNLVVGGLTASSIKPVPPRREGGGGRGGRGGGRGGRGGRDGDGERRGPRNGDKREGGTAVDSQCWRFRNQTFRAPPSLL